MPSLKRDERSQMIYVNLHVERATNEIPGRVSIKYNNKMMNNIRTQKKVNHQLVNVERCSMCMCAGYYYLPERILITFFVVFRFEYIILRFFLFRSYILLALARTKTSK